VPDADDTRPAVEHPHRQFGQRVEVDVDRHQRRRIDLDNCHCGQHRDPRCERLDGLLPETHVPGRNALQISRYGINLPIVRQPAGVYPYCNVAMYSTVLSQPGEAGPTFIYAHARAGMFLPLLRASQTNAASMVGTIVRIWTSDSRVHTYRISRVLRHQYTIPSYNANNEILWLQTSEGPHGTRNKLFFLATPISVDLVGYAESHPTPHIVTCGF